MPINQIMTEHFFFLSVIRYCAKIVFVKYVFQSHRDQALLFLIVTDASNSSWLKSKLLEWVLKGCLIDSFCIKY